MNGRLLGLAFFGTLLLLGVITHQAQAVEVDEQLLLDLKALVEKQQQRLDSQEMEIHQLKKQVAGLSAGTLAKASTAAEDQVLADIPDTVTTGNKNAEVQLYGHVNRAVLWADDGNSSKAYFVDNSNSQTRMGIKGKIQATDDFSVGTWIELGVTTNPSAVVDQVDNTSVSGDITKRQLDLFFQSKRYGKLSLGHGSTASDGSAEVDLSGTTVVSYSPIQDMAGGQLFYDTRNDTVSDVTIKSVYSNMDGLSRRDRLRYDSPDLNGFSIKGSWISGDAGDVALRYSRQFSGLKLAGAVAWASPGDIISSVDDQYDGSVSILVDNGFNATLAGGIRTLADDNRDNAHFLYAKLGYQAHLFTAGQSNFSADYAQSNNLSVNDDTASSFGLAFVQNIKEWGTEFYFAYRWHDLDRTGEDYDNIIAIMSGARVKF